MTFGISWQVGKREVKATEPLVLGCILRLVGSTLTMSQIVKKYTMPLAMMMMMMMMMMMINEYQIYHVALCHSLVYL